MRFDDGILIETAPGVYEPAEDTALMIESLEIRPGDDVLEVGCGTGIVALHCAKAGAKVTASDVSKKAIECARANAERNGLDVTFIESDLLEGIKGSYEVIVFNPPYLPEDEINDTSWTGGISGIEATISFLDQCRDHLSPGGRVFTIVSSNSDETKFNLAVEGMGYNDEKIAIRHIFFEDLAVHRLKRLSSE